MAFIVRTAYDDRNEQIDVHNRISTLLSGRPERTNSKTAVQVTYLVEFARVHKSTINHT